MATRSGTRSCKVRVSREFDDFMTQLNRRVNDERMKKGMMPMKKTKMTQLLVPPMQGLDISGLFGRKLKGNKKGSTVDMFLIVIVLGGFVLTALLMKQMLDNFNTSTAETGVLPQEWQDRSESQTDRMPALMSFIAAFLLVFFSIGAILGAMQIDTHPAFFIISILILIFLTLISWMMSSMVDNMASSEAITVANDFPLLIFIMGKMPIFAIILSIIIAIITYSRSRSL